MPNPNKIANVIRRWFEAVAQGRVDARAVSALTDEEVDELDAELMAELDAGIASDEEAIAEAEDTPVTNPE